jgi:hypothetical protein
MISPIKFYYSATQKDKLRTSTYSYFETKYFKKPFEETGFLESSERFLAKKLNFFLPGRIYTWHYDPEGVDTLDYYDRRPIVLVHSQYVAAGTNNMIVQGLNLNLFPELARVQTLQVFFETFEQDIKNAEAAISKNQIGTLNRVWQYLINWYFIVNLFNVKGKIGYQWAYRNYIIKNIKTPVLLELEDWNMIPFFVPKEFQGKGPADIWGEYVKSKTELNKKVINQQKSKTEQRKYIKPGGS